MSTDEGRGAGEGEAHRPAKVILVAGPSGSGKSTLARASGMPLLELDQFYRDGGDPGLPHNPALGIVDWDHPDAWNREAAVTAIVSLCRTGRATVPVYDIGSDRAVDSTTLSLEGHRRFIAEGIFAPDLIDELRERGVLADSIVVARKPWKNFARRLMRDVKDGRKPPSTLLKRGRGLWRSEDAWMQSCIAKGCRPLNAPETRAALAVAAALRV